MPPRKQAHKEVAVTNVVNPQQFLLKFAERNFQRQEIDEQSFIKFNKFVAILGKELSQKTSISDVEGFVAMVKTAFQNFQDLNRSRPTFSLYLQLLEICLSIFEKAVSLDLSREICFELLDILKPVYESIKPEDSFLKMQQKFKKINMPPSFSQQQTMTKINEFQGLPALYSQAKYEKLVNLTILTSSQDNGMHSIMRAYMNIEGENFLDSILVVLTKCINEHDHERFKKGLKIFLSIGDSTADQTKNLSVLITKILSSKNKIEFLYLIFTNTDLQKIFEPNHLFFVCLSTLDTILTDRQITPQTLELFAVVNKFLTIFRQIDKVSEQEKVLNLYNKVLSVVLLGKYAKQASQQKVKKLRSSELIRERLEKYQKQQPQARKFNFIQELANLQQLAELEDEAYIKKQDDPPLKQQQKLVPLKPEQLSKMSLCFRRLFASFATNNKIMPLIQKVYESHPRTQQFLKLCMVSHISPDALQLILASYIPLISSTKQYDIFTNIGKDDPSLMKIIKLRMLESKLQAEQIRNEQVFKKYYLPLHDRLVTPNGLNFEFLALTILHEYMDDFKMLLTELTKRCLQKIDTNAQNKAIYFRCTLALIASLLDLHHNIVIKLSYNRISMHVNKLNNKFQVQDFLALTQLKQNKLFLAGPRVQVSHQSDMELELLRNFITALFSKVEKLSDLFNLPSSEQNSYYYMILVQLCTLCMQRDNNNRFEIQSKQIQSIIQIRKNNKYSLGITITGQVISVLQNVTSMDRNQVSISPNQLTVVLHLLMKLESVMSEPSPPAKPSCEDVSMEQVNNTQISADKLGQVADLLTKLLAKIAIQPHFQSLKILCKSTGELNENSNPFDQLGTSLSSSGASSDQMLTKKNKLKECIKHFHMIKFYSEATSNEHMLSLMVTKNSIRVLELIWQKINKQGSNSELNKQKQSIQAFRLFYGHQAQNQSQKKSLQVYIKLRLLAMTGELENKLSFDQIKEMTKYLEENHDQVAKLLISEENDQKILGVQTIFQGKTNFIRYLLDQIVKSENQSLSDRQISLLTLSLLKTLIDNHNMVLEISKRHTFEKLENSEVITALVVSRTKKSLQNLKTLQKQKKSVKQEGPNESAKQRLCQKQQQKILEESKKIYVIFSKMLSSAGNLKNQKEQSILKMIETIIQFDDTTNIFVSIYILREILNISPILKCTLGKQASLALSQKIFTYLMLLKQNYSGVFINGAQQVTIFSIINYFVENFYAQSFSETFAAQLNDGIVVTQASKQTNQKSNQKMDQQSKAEKDKKPAKKCLMNQKKGSFRCVKCDPSRQICLNCTMICHKNHPVVFLQPNLRGTKSCQCSQQFCKINADFQKKKQVNQRHRKSKQTNRRQDYYKSYIEQLQRVPEQLRHLSDEDLEQQSFNFMYSGYGNSAIRAQESGLRTGARQPAIYGRPSDYGGARYGNIPIMGGMNPTGNVVVPPLNQGVTGAQFSAHFSGGRYGNPPGTGTAPLTGLIGGVNRYDHPPGSAAIMGLMGGVNPLDQQANLPNLGQPVPVPANHYFFSSRNEDQPNPLRPHNANMYQFIGRQNELASFLSLREQRQRDREIRERQILRERQRLRNKERERQQMRAFINESKYGLVPGDYPQKLIEKLDKLENHDNNDQAEQEDPAKDKFEDEDYEATILKVEETKSEVRLQQIKNNKNVQDLTMEHSYLLSEFINMAIELCQSKKDPSQNKEPEITWNIKLANPFVMNPSIMHTSSKMYAAKTFITKLAKTDGSFHPSPCVSRAPLAVSEKYIFVISGPKVNVHEKQQVFHYLIDKNGTTMNYEMVKQQHLQFEPHSVVVGHKNLVCVAGLHQVNIFECELGGQLVNRSNLRTSINNDNINKIRMNKFGVFLGLSREIRLLNHSLQNKMFFKLQHLVKQWCVLVNSEDSFTLYVTCSEGYIFYAQGNANSTGEIILIKKLIDSRSNHPVGSFFLAKKIEGCGVLLLSAFKDKSIGHSLSRLSGQSSIADLNYMKLNNQGLQPIFEKYYIMGLSDMALVSDGKQDKPSKQLIIVTTYKQDKNDIMAVHRGLLAVIRIKFDPVTGFSKPETQLICGEEERCQYFQLVWMEDRKNWVILSLGQDGSMRVTVPVKLNKASLEKQRSALKEKKVVHDKNDHQGKQKPEESKNNKSQEQQVYEKLSASIKQHISLKSLKESISTNSLSPNDYMQYIDSAEQLRYRQDYLISVSSADNQIKKYEIKQINKRKIITGFSLGECSDITLQTRKLEAVFQVAFTPEQALYYFAFGNIKFQKKKNDKQNYVLDSKRNNPLRSKNDPQAAEQRLFANPNNNKVLPGEVTVLGQVFEVSFKPKIKQFMQKLQKYMAISNPFEQSQLQKLESALKCCNLLLSNSLESNNCTVGHDEAIGFVQILKAGLLSNKSKQQLTNKLYPWIKRVIYKALKLQQCDGSNTKMHVFNDEYYPLKFATETKIKSLYESLNKKQISDQDYLLLVNQLYGFVAGFGQEQVDAVNQSPDIGMLLYYIAMYPSMLFKIHAKIKILQNAKLLYRVIPLYVFGYLTLKYLEYHLEWMLPALFEIVGKLVGSTMEPGVASNELKPSILSRYLLYKYLKQAQSIKLQPWLKNIVAVDAQQCLKQAPILTNKNSNGPGRQNLGGLSQYGFIQYPNGQFEMEDQEAMLRRVLQQSEREAARMNQNMGLDDFNMPKQAQNEMEPEFVHVASFPDCPKFLKQMLQQALKQIDYTTPPNTEGSCQKVAFFYTLYKLCRNNCINKVDSCKDSYEFICWSICEIVQKLCATYQQSNTGNNTASPQYTNTLCILMMWLNLFGMVFKDIKQNYAADEKLNGYYEKTKDSIMAALSKFKIQNVKKLQNVPNLFARRIKGHKILTKAHIIYGFISVLQRPCQANFVLLTLGCYWLFPHDEKYYQKKKYVDTIRENQKTGNINKIYQTAVSNLEIWKEVGDTEWLSAWVQDQRENWPRAIQLLTLYYQ